MKIIKNLTFAALAVALLFQTSIMRADDHGQRINNPFVTLLDGVYKPVALGKGPKHNLGLHQADLDDGSYLKIKIYNLDSGFPDPTDKAFGTFYVQYPIGDLCAYDLPKGSILAKFTFVDDVTTSYTLYPNPLLGPSWIFVGTEELVILEATGIYRSFVGGHIHMVDRLEYRDVDGTLLEHCFCHISKIENDDDNDE
jgi:hypothetical protein